jgi:hypothetical protein
LNVGVDPLLTDPPHFDFRPQAGSPAIDQGILYLYNQQYYGSAPDLGAVESGSRQWTYGLYDDPAAFVCNPALCFEDASLWTPVWGSSAALTNTKDRVEGSQALSLVPNDFIWLESPNMDQSVAKGFNMLQISMKFSTMVNPYYYGSIMFFFEVPSLNIYNQWVGQLDLTGLPLGIWNTKAMIIPSSLGAQLAGKTFSDFKVRMAVNIPKGSGPVILDWLHLLP